jgi:hypothetical protein
MRDGWLDCVVEALVALLASSEGRIFSVLTWQCEADSQGNMLLLALQVKEIKLFEGAWHNLLAGELPENIEKGYRAIFDFLNERAAEAMKGRGSRASR